MFISPLTAQNLLFLLVPYVFIQLYYLATWICRIKTYLNIVSHFAVPSFNLLTPNVNYSGRTTPLTSKVAFYIFIQQI